MLDFDVIKKHKDMIEQVYQKGIRAGQKSN
jgi:hypothetical protein